MRNITTRGLGTGALLTLASTATMMGSSAIETGSPWSGINAMATAVGKRRRFFETDYEPSVTPFGLLVLSGGLLAWGMAFQGALAKSKRRNSLVAGALSALGGYALDAFVLPKWVLPNFRGAMGSTGTFAKYAAMGLVSTLAARRFIRAQNKRLSGRRIAVLTGDGFEQIEVTTPVAALRREGAEVEVLALRPGKIVGMNLNVTGKRIRVSKMISRARPDDYDGLLIPGGFIAPDLLRQSEAARQFVRAFDEAGKPIAAICHGPWVLASAGLLQGRKITSWPGIRDDVVNAGASYVDEPLVQDNNFISSRGPQDLPSFTKAIVEHFSRLHLRGRTRGGATTAASIPSAPQSQTPPVAALVGLAAAPRLATLKRMLGLAGMVLVGGALALVLDQARQR
jgi:protease I